MGRSGNGPGRGQSRHCVGAQRRQERSSKRVIHHSLRSAARGTRHPKWRTNPGRCPIFVVRRAAKANQGARLLPARTRRKNETKDGLREDRKYEACTRGTHICMVLLWRRRESKEGCMRGEKGKQRNRERYSNVLACTEDLWPSRAIAEETHTSVDAQQHAQEQDAKWMVHRLRFSGQDTLLWLPFLGRCRHARMCDGIAAGRTPRLTWTHTNDDMGTRYKCISCVSASLLSSWEGHAATRACTTVRTEAIGHTQEARIAGRTQVVTRARTRTQQGSRTHSQKRHGTQPEAWNVCPRMQSARDKRRRTRHARIGTRTHVDDACVNIHAPM